MNKYKKLAKNSVVFAVGNFGSKFISIVMVSFYTVYLTTADYGTVDFISTLVSLLLPIFSLCVYESILRFALDKNISNKVVFTNLLLFQSALIIFTLFLCFILSQTNMSKFALLTTILLIVQMFQTLFAQFVRGIEHIISYSINGICMAIIIAISNIFFIAYLKLGIAGYLYSLILANSLSILFFLINDKLFIYFNIREIDTKFIKDSLKFSIPLIPNTLMWWLINSSSRFFIVYFLGASFNGLYAVSNKVPMVLTSLLGVFQQAWQMSAIEEYESTDKHDFFTHIYSFFSLVLFLSSSVIIAMLIPLFKFGIGSNFFESWKYVPLLVIGVIYSSLSSFLGTNYVAAKETRGLLITAMYCGIINLILNIILIPLVGVNGAGLASMISFVSLWFFRMRDTKKYITFYINTKLFFYNNLVLVFQITLLYLKYNPLTQLIFVFWIILINYSEIKKLLIRRN